MRDFKDILNRGISDELLAAYIDGNTTESENILIENALNDDSMLSEACEIVNDAVSFGSDFDWDLHKGDFGFWEMGPPPAITEDDIDNFMTMECNSKLTTNEIIELQGLHEIEINSHNKNQMGMLHIEEFGVSKAGDIQSKCIEEAQKQYGLEPKNIKFDPNTYQWEQDTCAIRSQEIVLRSFGLDFSQSDLINEATSHGWYTKGQGTNLEDVGNLLDLHNIPNHRIENANVFNLVDELGHGHKVIVGVDVDELYGNSFWQSIKEFLIGKTPNHAMIVSGIDTSDPNNTMVVLTDPGTGKTLFECPYERFLSAWNDSECFMVATDDPAPLEFNSDTMINFDYDKGHVSFLGKMPFEKFHNEVVPNVDDYLDSLDSYIDSLEKFRLSDVKTLDQFEDMMDKADIAHQKAHDLKADNLHEKLSKSFNSSTDDSDDDSREPEDLDPEDDSTHHDEENEESNDDASDIDELDEL